MQRFLFMTMVVCLFASCRSSEGGIANGSRENTGPATVAGILRASTASSADLRILFVGNSHSAPIPPLLKAIFAARQPDRKVFIRRAPGSGFLAAHADSADTRKLIRKGKWDIVVLQAQKYSTTGRYTYPTDGAITLSEIATESGASLIMYPEWSRKEKPDEYKRIRAIHDSIAKETGAKVAPVGEAWQIAINQFEQDDLYAHDGNHASRSGSYLTACVFYALIAGENPELVSDDQKQTATPVKEARTLEKAAWAAIEQSASEQQANDSLGK